MSAFTLYMTEKEPKQPSKITLPEADWNLLYDALINPLPPNDTLKAAFKRYREKQPKKKVRPVDTYFICS